MGICRSCEEFDIYQVVSQTASSGLVRIPMDTIESGQCQLCEFCLILGVAAKKSETEWARPGRKEYLCLALFDSKKKPVIDLTRPEVTSVGVWIEAKHGVAFSAQRNSQTTYFPVVADLSSPAATSGVVRGRFLGLETDSKETYSIISEWLIRCCMNHRGCSLSIPTGPQFSHPEVALPTRCLEITHKKLRLCETKGKKGTYVILSHRWAKATELCSTTTTNYDARLQGRDLYELTEIFKDAIDITLNLGFRYLWIDSLCIIQQGDGGKDWKEEATNMAQYYQHAVFTIFAMRSQDESKRIFVKREPRFDLLVRLPFRDRAGRPNGHFYITDQQDVDFAGKFHSQVRRQGLFNRGWIFQEWFLSTRIVYFTSRGVWFECKTGYPVTENQEEVDHRDEVTSTLADSESGRQLISFYKASISGHDVKPDNLWYVLVQLYSGLDITDPSKDRIIALAGVAKAISDMFMEKDKKRGAKSQCYEYVAGLWLRDIHHGLLWYQRYPDEEYTPLADLPTWSWASSMHAVSWFERNSPGAPAMIVTALATKLPNSDAYTWFTIEELSRASGGIPLPGDFDGEPRSIRLFDVDNMFSRLRMSVKMLPILVGQKLNDDQHESLRKETGIINSSLAGRGNKSHPMIWYSISSASDTKGLAGWATIEIPHLFTQLESYAASMVSALHISTRTDVPGRDLYLSSFRLKHTVYDVLMVEHIGDNCYRRVGMGCIFGGALMKQFDEVESSQLDLV